MLSTGRSRRWRTPLERSRRKVAATKVAVARCFSIEAEARASRLASRRGNTRGCRHLLAPTRGKAVPEQTSMPVLAPMR